MIRLCCLVLLPLVWAAGGELASFREGRYWVLVQSAEFPVVVNGALSVRAKGPITVRGGSQAASYLLRTKVVAATEADAKQLLNSVRIGVAGNGRESVLTLSRTKDVEVACELEVRVPSALAKLNLETQAGDLQVYDIDGSVQAETGGGSIQMDRIGRDVTAKTAGGPLRFGTIGGSGRCFSGGGSITVDRVGAESWFETAGGEIDVRDAGGPLHASTAGGNIRVQHAAGAVSARTAGGRIDIHEAGGLVSAGNTGGSIQVGQSTGVRCESTGGSIRLRGTSGSLRAVSDVGSIFAELVNGMAMSDSVLSTSTGDITVFIPTDLALTVRVLKEGSRVGRVVSDFLELPFSANHIEGTLNGGGPLLQVSTASGNIYLRRVRQE